MDGPTSDTAATIRGRLFEAISASEPGELVIVSVTGEQLTVYGQAHLGKDFVEFQADANPQDLAVVPFDKIAFVRL